MKYAHAGRWTRDGKEFDFDLIKGRVDNSNMVLLGASGSGKSVNLVEKLMDSVEHHNARLIIIEPGTSFELMVTALEAQGKTIKRHAFTNKNSLLRFGADLCQEDAMSSVITEMGIELADQMLCANGTMQDVIHFNIARFTQRENEKQKIAAVTSILSAVAGCLIEQESCSRPTIVVCDEFHYLLNGTGLNSVIPILAAVIDELNQHNAWIWVSSQNIRDIPFQLSNMLKQFEWWEILHIDEGEVEYLKTYRSLSESQVLQLNSLDRRRSEFVEGVLLSKSGGPINPIFRFVPKSFSLALMMTDPAEKNQRLYFMREYSLSELAAVVRIAENLDAIRFKS